MGQNKASTRRAIELIIFVTIIVCVGLILFELATNVMAEMSSEGALLLQVIG
jgi:hypothetical protein